MFQNLISSTRRPLSFIPGELGLQRGDDLVGLGGLGAQVLAEVGDLLGERVVLGDEGRDLPLHALQQLAHGL